MISPDVIHDAVTSFQREDGLCNEPSPPEIPFGELDPDELRNRMLPLDHLQMEKLVLSLASDVALWRGRFYQLEGFK